MPRWPHDDPASLAAFYGDPDKGEPGHQLVPVIPPFQMYYDGKPIAKIMFHVKAAGALKAALDDIWKSCRCDQSLVDRLGISRFSGAYNPRKIRGSTTRWSNHAYGAAIDFDAEHNGFNTGHGTIPQLVIDAFKRQGALWGGDYQGRTDPMHFEFCSRAPVATPLSFIGDVQADGDSDAALPGGNAGDASDTAAVPAAPAGPEASPAKPSVGGFFGRMRNMVVTAASSIGLTSLGALTNGQVVALLLGFAALSVLVCFLVALWLWGKQNVADWIAKHIA